MFSPSTVAHLNAEPRRKAACEARGSKTRARNVTKRKKKNQRKMKKSQRSLCLGGGCDAVSRVSSSSVEMLHQVAAAERRAAGLGGTHVCSRSTCCYARSETVIKHRALHTLVKRSDQITKKINKTNKQTKERRKKKTEDTVCGTLNTTQHS